MAAQSNALKDFAFLVPKFSKTTLAVNFQSFKLVSTKIGSDLFSGCKKHNPRKQVNLIVRIFSAYFAINIRKSFYNPKS